MGVSWGSLEGVQAPLPSCSSLDHSHFPLLVSTLPGQIRKPPLLSVPVAASSDSGNWVTIPTAETTNWCEHQEELSCQGQTSIREQQEAHTGLGKGFDLFLSCRGPRLLLILPLHLSAKYHSRSDRVNKYSGGDSSVS